MSFFRERWLCLAESLISVHCMSRGSLVMSWRTLFMPWGSLVMSWGYLVMPRGSRFMSRESLIMPGRLWGPLISVPHVVDLFLHDFLVTAGVFLQD